MPPLFQTTKGCEVMKFKKRISRKQLRMKWLVIMAFLIVIVVSIWIFLFYRAFLNRRPNDIADQKRILVLYKTNHADLLSACKKLMQKKMMDY